MELRELKYFLAVASEGSISAAAERLYMTQPSLSRQMQKLEKEVGSPLFLRGSRRISLTDTGRLLEKRAQELLDLYEKTVSEVLSPEKEISGEVYIGGGESRAVTHIIRAALAVRAEHPAIKFRFFSGDAAAVAEKLDKGLIDFGVMLDMPDLTAYRSLTLPHYDRWGVLMPQDSPLAEKDTVSAADLADKPLICSEQSLAKGLIAELFKKPTAELNIAATYNLIYVASQLVSEGAGYALGLDIINTHGSGLCFKYLAPEVKNRADLVWKKHAVFSQPAKLFLKAVTAECGDSNTLTI